MFNNDDTSNNVTMPSLALLVLVSIMSWAMSKATFKFPGMTPKKIIYYLDSATDQSYWRLLQSRVK